MIESLERVMKGMKEWQDNVEEIIIDLAKNEEILIEAMNTQDQMYTQGIRADGNDIRPKYTAFTKVIKRQKGQPTNRVTLRDTGAFHKSVGVKWGRKEFKLVAGDMKVIDLVRKYGPEILGLTQKNVGVLGGVIKPQAIKRFKKMING
jgi:hypothetical protein